MIYTVNHDKPAASQLATVLALQGPSCLLTCAYTLKMTHIYVRLLTKNGASGVETSCPTEQSVHTHNDCFTLLQSDAFPLNLGISLQICLCICLFLPVPTTAVYRSC